MNLSFGLAEIFTISNILMSFLGVFVGIIIGALPGLTPTMGIALMLPFTFSLEPLPSFALLLGIYVGGTYGGSISAILIRTPGTPQAVATVLDGYPLARSGKASEALSIAVIASGFGGILSNIILMLLAGQIAKVALAFGPAEYFAIGLFGLSMVASFCAKGIDKGIFACGIGLLISTIGIDEIGGMGRFAYTKNMIGGIQTVSALIGLFALTEVINKAVDSVHHEKIEETVVSNKLVPAKEVVRNLPNMIRSGIIGTFIGIVPATGGGIAAFISYNEARRASKHPEMFGKGSYEGIFAAESANNGVTGGALIPLLTLGVPGDTITAVLMGATGRRRRFADQHAESASADLQYLHDHSRPRGHKSVHACHQDPERRPAALRHAPVLHRIVCVRQQDIRYSNGPGHGRRRFPLHARRHSGSTYAPWPDSGIDDRDQYETRSRHFQRQLVDLREETDLPGLPYPLARFYPFRSAQRRSSDEKEQGKEDGVGRP